MACTTTTTSSPSSSKLLLSDRIASMNDNIPSNYIRPVSERPNLSQVQQSSKDSSIPLIDLQQLDGPNHSEIIKKIGHACQYDGFFQVKNHGVPEIIIEKMMQAGKEFFRLPESERMKCYSDDTSKTTRLSTSFNVTNEKVANWRDFLRLHCYPLEDYVNEWPTNPSSFSDDGKKQKKEKGPAIASSDDQQHRINEWNSGNKQIGKESNQGKKAKKDKGNTFGNNVVPSEEQQIGVMGQNGGCVHHDDKQKEQLNTNKKDKKKRR